MTLPPRLPALALLPFLAAPAGEVLAVRASAGDVLVRTYETRSDAQLSEASFVVDGEEQEVPDVPDFRAEGSGRIVVTDEILEVEDGLPVRLRRAYEEAYEHQETEWEGGGQVTERESPAEGAVVVFARDEDGEWSAEVEEGALDADLLQGLRADLSLAELLPAGEVEEGDSWDVEPSAFAVIFQPAGELRMEDGEEQAFDRARVARHLADSIDGTVAATYRGTREADGATLAAIALEVQVEMRADVDEEGTTTIVLERDLEGEILWDLERGRLHLLQLDGDASETVTVEGVLETPEGAFEVERTRTFSGTIAYRFRVD